MKKGRFLRKIISLVLSSAIVAQCLAVNVSATEKLAAPVNVEASNIKDTSISLKWSSVSGADAYRVYLWNYETDKWESKAYVNGTSAKITDLEPNTICKFRVASYDLVNGNYTKQNSSKTFKFKTKKETLPGPTGVHATSVRSTSVRLSWNEVKDADAYLVWYRKQGTTKWLYVKNSGKKSYTSNTVMDISDYEADTLYEFRVKTYRIENEQYVEQGVSDTYTLQTRSDPDLLPAHTNIKVKARNNRVDFSWDTTNKLVSYEGPFAVIECWNEKTGEWETIKDQRGNDRVVNGTQATLYDLKPNKTYKYRIITLAKKDYKSFTWQNKSKVITVKTPKITANEWNGTADTSWYTGDKTSYDISTPEQLAGLASLVNNRNSFSGITINLKKDIKLNDTSDWQDWLDCAPANTWNPIGNASYHVFCGMFNGNGHTISGLYATSTQAAGLFGYAGGAVIVNVKLEKSVIDRPDHSVDPIGGIVGKSQNSYIDSCDVDGLIIRGWNSPVAIDIYMGGIVGDAYRFDYSAFMFQVFSVALFGVLWNPILVLGSSGTTTPGTYINNCIANNVTIHAPTAQAGCIIGGSEGVFINNCLSTNCTIESGCRSGAIIAEGKGEMENCYYYNYNMTGINKNQYDETSATAITEKTLTSSSFAKKLGSAFEYSNGNPPKLRFKTT